MFEDDLATSSAPSVSTLPENSSTKLSIRSMLGMPAGGPISRAVTDSADRLLGLHALSSVYAEVNRTSDGPFCSRVLRSLGIAAEVHADDLARVPAAGAVIIAANHPLGGADGLLLLDTLLRVRPDVKLLANAWLAAIPELGEHVIPVDVFSPKSFMNTRALRDCLRWLKNGGCLATFPAGEVSRLALLDAEISDCAWTGSVSTLSIKTNAPVVPVLFATSNSWLFQAAGQLHGSIRTALLPRELLWKRGQKVRVHIGSKIEPDRLRRFADPLAASDFLRARAYLLAERSRPEPNLSAPALPAQAAIALPEDPAAIAREVASLPASATISRIGTQRVLLATAAEIPTILREIGRLRETTFRAVGEGTGQACDLDHFDESYRHLFVFDDSNNDIVGAYRMGLTDELVAKSGMAGLYTSTLFRYEPSELRRLVPGIELGRSFVRAEYQRHPASLLLLWHGIGRFAAMNPQYRYLFGTASISDTYPSVTKKLLVRFITETFGPGEWARVAQPTTPPKFNSRRDREVELAYSQLDDMRDADELVASIDPQGRGIPILLRMYLRLGARMLGFNVDPAFGDALDGLIVVDLVKAPSRQIRRYMGDELYASFMAYHNAPIPA